ncbi:MAG: putative lipid flippase MurJ, partial [Candidatus Poribacteria bacterium]|nr:putative lipid flippase MurJ [Candidatus Poribacteria bacterium]
VRTPAIVSVFTIIVNMISNYLFIFKFGLDHRSLAISTSFTITINFVLVLGLLSRRVKGIGWHSIVSVFIKSVIVSACMGVIAKLAYSFLTVTGSVISLLIAIIVSVFTLYVLYSLMKVSEFNQIVDYVMKKIKR